MKIKVKGVIVGNSDKWIYDWFGVDATCPRDIEDALDKAEDGEDIEVDISSGGGSVYAGSDIYTLLKSYAGKVIINITSMAASAASVIAMAGDVVRISPTAQLMIHNVSGGVHGDYRTMDKMSEILKNYNKSIANAYRLKTKLSEEKLLELMNEESYMTAQLAKELGFVDEVMFDDELQLTASIQSGGLLPDEVINKMRNSPMNPTKKKFYARLRLLRLKGEAHD